mmetsp:Transcript_22814/g.51176  ORF Transcript_22814/g.51176 Transcript_22814/m.51176 type:complete len:126 (+) Transcript_22814:127-504(+)
MAARGRGGGNRGGGGGGGGSAFDTYRQIAPQSLDDNALREIIKNAGQNRDAIVGILENIWDAPSQPVTEEWVTSGKARKTTPAPISGMAGRGPGRGGAGRGGDGRGRGAPFAAGRGGVPGTGRER